MADSLGADPSRADCALQNSLERTFMIEYVFGNIFSLMIGTATLTLCIQYLVHHTSDTRLFRGTIALLTLCTITSLVLMFTDSIDNFAIGFGNLVKATSNGPFYGGSMMMCGITGFFVQSFYAYRCFRVLNRNYFAGALIMALATWSLASWMWLWIVLVGPSDTEAYETLGWKQGLGLIASIATDAVCFGFLVWGLHRAALKSGGSGSQSFKSSGKFKRLITLAVTTNLLTIYIALEPSIPHLYTLTALAWLGARGQVKNTGINTMQTKSALTMRQQLQIRSVQRRNPSLDARADQITISFNEATAAAQVDGTTEDGSSFQHLPSKITQDRLKNGE